MKKLTGSAPCPCGSGKTYKQCSCWSKAFEWMQEDDGAITKRVPISPELREALEESSATFRAASGREPGPKDPHFGPVDFGLAEAAAAMRAAGIDPAKVYAFEKTGRIVTEANMKFLTEAELDEWDDAVEEYEREHPRGSEKCDLN